MYMKLVKLPDSASEEEVKEYMLFHRINADSKKAKTNPAVNRQQVWNFTMNKLINGDFEKEKEEIIRTIKEEFGRCYMVKVEEGSD